MKNPFDITILFAILAMACAPKGNKNNCADSFNDDLTTHLNAIQNRNYDELEPTVAENVLMIGPDGSTLESKKAFMDFHREWFQQKNWEWKGDILRSKCSDSLAHALVKYRYIEKDSIGNEVYRSDALLIIIFRNGKDGWQLLHDQNTKIQNTNIQ